MAKDFFSKEVCEQLAHELVTEQAELLKHEALVKTMKEKLVEGKKQLIWSLIGRKTFLFEGKRMTALAIDFYVEADSMVVYVTFGLDAADVVGDRLLTRKEKCLLKEYNMQCKLCREPGYEDVEKEALETAETLAFLKNGINLLRYYAWTVDFSNPSSSNFFTESSMIVLDEYGTILLEELTC